MTISGKIIHVINLHVITLILCGSCHSSHRHKDNVLETLPIIPDEKTTKNTRHALQTRILYLIQKQKTEEAITCIQKALRDDPLFLHSGILQTLGMRLLEEGIRSADAENIILSLYGAQISLHEYSEKLATLALSNADPMVQLTALHVLASFDTDETNQQLSSALKSPYEIIQLEAAYYLAHKKNSNCTLQLEALMTKLDPEFTFCFPKLFVQDSSYQSTQILKHFLHDQDEKVRIEAILALAESHRDDLQQEVLSLASDPSPSVLEALCSYLRMIKDDSKKEVLQDIASSSIESTSLAAHFALYELGEQNQKAFIERLATKGNLCAISLLGNIQSSSCEILEKKMLSQDVSVQVNSALALLETRHNECLPGLIQILFRTNRDLTFQPMQSPGRTITYCKVVPSSLEKLTKQAFETSLCFREEVLRKALDLDEDYFLQLAEAIFENEQYDLIACVVQLLENLRNEKSIALLQRYQEQPGAPFIRMYCTLALFRLGKKQPNLSLLENWVKKSDSKAVFQMRPLIPTQIYEGKQYSLTLQDTSRLLVETFQSLAESQSKEGIDVLLETMKTGNRQNRYLLAGLLMRCSQ